MRRRGDGGDGAALPLAVNLSLSTSLAHAHPSLPLMTHLAYAPDCAHDCRPCQPLSAWELLARPNFNRPVLPYTPDEVRTVMLMPLPLQAHLLRLLLRLPAAAGSL